MKTEDHTLRRNWNRWEACFVARRIDFAIVGIRKFNDFAGERIVEAESSFPVADTLFWKKHPILFWINSPRSTIKNSFKVLSSSISTDIEDCVYFVCEKGRRDGTNRHSSPSSRAIYRHIWQYLLLANSCKLPGNVSDRRIKDYWQSNLWHHEEDQTMNKSIFCGPLQTNWKSDCYTNQSSRVCSCD